MPRFGKIADDLLRDAGDMGSGNANDTDATTAGRRRDGYYGVRVKLKICSHWLTE